MEKIKKLLGQISKIVVEEKTQQEERRKRGENFNIFKVLGVSSSEVRLHSAFLAELLNPNGDHGLEDKFLKAFIEIVIGKKTNLDFDTKSAKTYVEYNIGAISEDYKEGGRIDILIYDENGKSIIIENKIYAGDQPWQMYRYNRFAENNYSTGNYTLLYLTLDGHQPSEKSTGKEPKFNFFCISYKEDILGWLSHCIGVAALFPAIRETISQYMFNLKILLNIMSDFSEKKFMKTLVDSQNVEATLRIISEKDHIKETIRKTFLHGLKDRLKNTLEECRMEIDLSEVDRVIKLATDCPRIYFRSFEHKKSAFAIEIGGRQALYGVVLNCDNPNKILMNNTYSNKANYGWPYGYSFFDGDLCYWDSTEALLDMAKGNKIYETIEKEIIRVMEMGLLSKLEEKISSK